MRRVCAACEREYNDQEQSAMARIDGVHYQACSGFCLVELITGAHLPQPLPQSLA